MENALYVGLSRQVVLRRQLAVVANNIANAGTTGYKAQRMQFAQHLAATGSGGSSSGREISMVIDRDTVRDTRAGRIEQTGNPLDVAIFGPGYMVVETEAGPRYTRVGHLSVDNDGRLVNGDRLPILGDNDAPIILPTGGRGLEIASDGVMTGSQGPIGKLKLVSFENEQDMIPVGRGLLDSDEEPQPADGVTLSQGMLEGSNVQAIVEMTRMIDIARQYQSTQRLLQDEHNRQRDSIGRLAGTSQR